MKNINKIIAIIFLIAIAINCVPISINGQTTENIPGTFNSLSQNQSSVTKSTTLSSSTAITNSTLTAVSGLQQFYSSTGQYTISADAVGSLSSSMNIRVNKPNAQATVQKAILISSVTFNTISNGCVTIAGVPVNWDGTASAAFFNNYWADVTSIVAAPINGFPAGISTLNITECNTGSIEGEALLVVFKDALASEKTIIVMLGAINPAGDNFSVTLAQPIDPNQPGALLDMGLGIGFGFQQFGGGQISQVSVNNQRITSSAGGEDDGAHTNGALITVGGIGDANTNPPNPFAPPVNERSDDELYSILPFITNTTTSLNINTINPSNDDNIFLAYFALSGAAIIGEGILLSQTSTSGNVGENHTVKAVLVNSLGQPIPNRPVLFTITSGPNSGGTFTTNTDANGEAFYTYTGNGGVGTDNIQACFTNSQNQSSCSNTLFFDWISTNSPPVAVCKPVTISVNGNCSGNAVASDFNNGSTDADGDVLSFAVSPQGPYAIGTTNVILTVTDAKGASTSCATTITVVDNTPPLISTNGNKIVNNDAGKCGAAIAVSASATDNCTVGTPTGVRSDGLALTDEYPVGTTTITWNVTDANGNPAATVLQTITVNNDPPIVGSITVQSSPVAINTPFNLTIPFTDNTNNVVKAVINWEGVSQTINAAPNLTLTSPLIVPHTYTVPGVYTITVTLTDACGLTANAIYNYVVAYDPNGSFVTGGGWINSPAGAYRSNPDLTGRANFGFVSKYQKGATVPTGNTEFQYQTGGMNFNSTSYDWLVVSGSRAQYKGLGTINGGGNYGFLLTGVDGDLGTTKTPDLFRIKIWDINNGGKIVYDNQFGAGDGDALTTTLAGGSIVIHTPTGKNSTATSPASIVNATSELQDITNAGKLTATVLPNPARGKFTIRFGNTNLNQKVNVRVTDMIGRLIETRANLAPSEAVQLGEHYTPGTYLIEVIQGTQRKTLKVIKGE